ncbi:MAG: DUF6384 family protein [Alphaproteobacteria bacterium]
MADPQTLPAAQGDEKLDDIMLAMDVVDTLRHERIMTERDLAATDRREALIARLRGIYKAQGIEVPDSVLMDGVLALEEQRFAYAPPKAGFGTSLARLYIGRRKWLPLIYTLVFIVGAVLTINYAGFVRPAKVEANRIETLLTKTYPQSLTEARDKALGLAATDTIKARAQALYDDGVLAIGEKDFITAKTRVDSLAALANDLSQQYTLRIVSRPGEMSGVFRLNDDGDAEVRNYYLIVEGLNAAGTALKVSITSEEDQKTARVSKWGVRVSEDVFYGVAADKRDDQIIQKAVIGQKKRGYLLPDYSIETSGGTILEWQDD